MWPVGPKKMGLFLDFLLSCILRSIFSKNLSDKKIPIWDYPKRQKKIPRDLQKSQALG